MKIHLLSTSLPLEPNPPFLPSNSLRYPRCYPRWRGEEHILPSRSWSLYEHNRQHNRQQRLTRHLPRKTARTTPPAFTSALQWKRHQAPSPRIKLRVSSRTQSAPPSPHFRGTMRCAKRLCAIILRSHPAPRWRWRLTSLQRSGERCRMQLSRVSYCWRSTKCDLVKQ